MHFLHFYDVQYVFFSNFARCMEQMQFSAIVIMAILTAKLLLLPERTLAKTSLGRARWLLTASTALLAIQFTLQYALHLRSTGHVAMAIMLNLASFMPVTTLFTLAILYVIRPNHVTRLDKLILIPTWFGALGFLAYGLADGSTPFEAETMRLKWCEAAAGVCYEAMQLYYFFRNTNELRMLRKTLANYYDRDTDGMLSWMEVSISLLAIIALMVPPIIFSNGWWLILFSLTVFAGIFYMIDSFCLYVVGTSSAKVREAEQSDEIEENEAKEHENILDIDGFDKNNEYDSKKLDSISHDVFLRIAQAVSQWTERGGHLRTGIKMPDAANEIGVPRYQLSQWLRHQNKRYSDWITELRIEEAKRTLTMHNDWSNEAVALHCGFNDRSYFQKKFKESTGITPTDYQIKMRD